MFQNLLKNALERKIENDSFKMINFSMSDSKDKET